MGAPWQTPAWHASVCVQALLSLQARPSGLGWGRQRFEASSHTPSLHWLPAALQLSGFPPHTPSVHASFTVQNRPSLQTTPFGFGGFVQAPILGSQTPAV